MTAAPVCLKLHDRLRCPCFQTIAYSWCTRHLPPACSVLLGEACEWLCCAESAKHLCSVVCPQFHHRLHTTPFTCLHHLRPSVQVCLDDAGSLPNRSAAWSLHRPALLARLLWPVWQAASGAGLSSCAAQPAAGMQQLHKRRRLPGAYRLAVGRTPPAHGRYSSKCSSIRCSLSVSALAFRAVVHSDRLLVFGVFGSRHQTH